jgi:mitochondrial fission protein ELM1
MSGVHLLRPGVEDAPVWVLDDTGVEAAPAVAIAERLGVRFRRIPLVWNWMAHVAGLAPHGSLMGLAPRLRGAALPRTVLLPRGGTLAAAGNVAAPLALARGSEGPRLAICAGPRAAAVGLWLKARFGCRLVQCLGPGIGGWLRAGAFDLLVLPEHDRPPDLPNVFPVYGTPHRLSPLALGQAASAWAERLAHLPRPRVALLVGGRVRGSELPPASTHALGRRVARMAARQHGSVLAATGRRTGGEASDALAAGLGRAMHLLYRWGEPGEDPTLGFLATADVIVVTAESERVLAEACATGAPVFYALPELAGPRQRRMLDGLVRAGHVQPLRDTLAPFSRTPLDEAGRVAREVLRRFPID